MRHGRATGLGITLQDDGLLRRSQPLVITSEYSTGMIRTSLAVMPRRGVLYAAKAIVFAAVTLTIS